MAAAIQRQTDQQELQCSLLALAAKAGLVLLGCVSLIRLSVATDRRIKLTQPNRTRPALAAKARRLHCSSCWSVCR